MYYCRAVVVTLYLYMRRKPVVSTTLSNYCSPFLAFLRFVLRSIAIVMVCSYRLSLWCALGSETLSFPYVAGCWPQRTCSSFRTVTCRSPVSDALGKYKLYEYVKRCFCDYGWYRTCCRSTTEHRCVNAGLYAAVRGSSL